MAKLKQKQLNNPIGKLGDVIFYKVKNQSILRSIPRISKKSKFSQKQIFHRRRFSFLGQIFSIFKPIIRYNLNGLEINKSALFFQLNLNLLQKDNSGLKINLSQLLFCNVTSKNLLDLKITQVNGEIFFHWEKDELDSKDFKVLTAIYILDSKKLYWSEVFRSELNSKIKIPNLNSDWIPFAFGFRSFS